MELYNWRKCGQIHEIDKMIELEKMRVSITKNSCNLNAHQINEISLVLYIAYWVPKNQDKILF